MNHRTVPFTVPLFFLHSISLLFLSLFLFSSFFLPFHPLFNFHLLGAESTRDSHGVQPHVGRRQDAASLSRDPFRGLSCEAKVFVHEHEAVDTGRGKTVALPRVDTAQPRH